MDVVLYRVRLLRGGLLRHRRLEFGHPRHTFLHIRPVTHQGRACVARRYLPVVELDGRRLEPIEYAACRRGVALVGQAGVLDFERRVRFRRHRLDHAFDRGLGWRPGCPTLGLRGRKGWRARRWWGWDGRRHLRARSCFRSRRLAHIQEDETGGLAFRGHVGIDRRLRLRRPGRPHGQAPLRIAVRLQVVFQHPPKVRAFRQDVSQLLERRERLLDLPRLLHPLGVLNEVLCGFGDEPLGRVQLGKLEVDGVSPGRVAQHLVAHRDCVVVEPVLRILVDGPVVIVRRRGGIPDLEVKVSHAVEDGQVGIGLGLAFLTWLTISFISNFASRALAFCLSFSSRDMAP